MSSRLDSEAKLSYGMGKHAHSHSNGKIKDRLLSSALRQREAFRLDERFIARFGYEAPSYRNVPTSSAGGAVSLQTLGSPARSTGGYISPGVLAVWCFADMPPQFGCLVPSCLLDRSCSTPEAMSQASRPLQTWELSALSPPCVRRVSCSILSLEGPCALAFVCRTSCAKGYWNGERVWGRVFIKVA